MPQAYSTLDQAYDSPIIRLNAEQIEVSEWLKDNIDVNQNVSIIGPPPEIMQKVWWMSSFSHRVSSFFEGYITWITFKNNREDTIISHIANDVLVVDYSDISLFSDRSFVERWLLFEQQNLANHTLLYQTDRIRVYKYGP